MGYRYTMKADAHVRAMERLAAAEDGEGAVFNLETGMGISVQEILDAIVRVTCHPVPYAQGPRRQGDPPVLVADGSAAQRALGWRPLHSSLGNMIETA